MTEKCLVTLRLRAGTLTAEVPPEETEELLAALARLYGKYWIAYVKDDTGRLWSWAYGHSGFHTHCTRGDFGSSLLSSCIATAIHSRAICRRRSRSSLDYRRIGRAARNRARNQRIPGLSPSQQQCPTTWATQTQHCCTGVGAC